MLKKLTKQIWYYDELWDVVEVISPNTFDDFILIRRDKETVHSDDSLAVSMCLIDAHNDTFYPNTKEVRECMKKIQMAEIKRSKNDVQLTQAWLNCVLDF